MWVFSVGMGRGLRCMYSHSVLCYEAHREIESHGSMDRSQEILQILGVKNITKAHSEMPP